MSLQISNKTRLMPASAIRKLVPFADAAKEQGVKVYHLNVGAPDIKSPQCAIDEVIRRCQDMHHLSYTNSAGLMELRKGLVEKYYKKIGIDIEVSELLVEVAGSEAFASAMQIAADRGDEIIDDDFRIPDISEFEKLVTDRTKAVLISNPCNPSGKLFTREEMLAIGDFCKRHDLFLISDEVYREFCYTDEPHFSAMNIPGCEQNVILVDSVSKRYNLCGARIGCIVSHNKDVMAAALKFAQSRLCPPVLGQYSAIGALDTPQSYFDEVKQEYIRRRDCAVGMLNEIPGVRASMPYGAFYTIAELPVEDAEDFVKWMLTDFRVDSQTTMVTPAGSFYKTSGAGRNQVRIAYVLEVPELKKAINILGEGLSAYKSLSGNAY